ncbi:MAG: lamin tail domain-containing protein [Candidatus Scalindua sp.]
MNDLKKEDGYILVVVIGILTILSLMTITFATLSRIETRAARNYADSVKCEMVAKAGLEHAIYIIRQDKFGDDDVAYNSDNGDENYDQKGNASWPGDGVFDGTDYDNDGDTTNDSAWIYFPATTSSLDIRLPGKLRARYAVLITDDREARVNVNVTGNKVNGGVHTSNEGWSTFEIDLSGIISQVSGTSTTIASDIIDTRLGSDTAPGTSTTNDDTGIISDPQTDKIDNDGDWTTGNDTNGNGIPDFGETNVDEGDNSESIDEPNEFNSVFPYGDDIPFGILSEAEIMGTSSYTSRLETIFNTRGVLLSEQRSFNSWVTTYSADTILCPPYTLDGGTSTTMLNINALVNNEGVYTDTGTYGSDKKVEMIMDVLVAGGLTGSAGSSNYVERHQLAVNILDFIDSNGTVTAYNDGSDTYYGVERTPYINEVEAWPQGSNPEFIELFNPYDTAITIGDWTITGSSLGTVTIAGGASIPAGGYYVITDGGAADQTEAGMNLVDEGEPLTLKTDPGSGNITVQVTDYGIANKPQSSQLNDPRPIPLSASASNPWFWESLNSTIGAQNGNFQPSDGSDGWENTTPTWPDSFLVANRRFSNKGYLGFIHRGSEWSSFLVDSSIAYPNILQYFTVTDPSMDNIDNDGDISKDTTDTGSQSGDFDGPEYLIPGLINVNTAPTEVLQSLPNIDSIIGNAIDTLENKPYTSIGDLVAKVPDITNTGATKWDREKPLRSISNLITTRSNVFTVYVTAQITDEAMSTVYAEKRILAIVDRSVNPIRVRYFRWIVE